MANTRKSETDINAPFDSFPSKLNELILSYLSSKELVLLNRSLKDSSDELKQSVNEVLKNKWPQFINNLKDIMMIRLSEYSQLDKMGLDEQGYRERCHSIRSELFRLIQQDIESPKESSITADCIHHCFIFPHSLEKERCASLFINAMKNGRIAIIKALIPYAEIILGQDWVLALIEGTQFGVETYQYELVDLLAINEDKICLRLSHEDVKPPLFSRPLTPLLFVALSHRFDLVEKYALKYPNEIRETYHFLDNLKAEIDSHTELQKSICDTNGMKDRLDSGKFNLLIADHINKTGKMIDFTENDKQLIQNGWLKRIKQVTHLSELSEIYMNHQDAVYLNYKRCDTVYNRLNYGLSFFLSKEYYTNTKIKFIEALQERAYCLIKNKDEAKKALESPLFSAKHTEHGVTEKYRDHLKSFFDIYKHIPDQKPARMIISYL